MELAYKKYNNDNLFSNFENVEFTNLSNIQNYIPIYQKFFALNESNYNSINLNNKYYIRNITSKESDNKYTGEVSDISNEITIKQMFFKYSPLLDPTKYITGKYDASHSDLIKLPRFVDGESHAKLCDSLALSGVFYCGFIETGV